MSPKIEITQVDVNTAAAIGALMQGPVLIEIEPGHVVDLQKVIEFHDSPKNKVLLLLLPAPSVAADLPGPHGIAISGKARRLALQYMRLLRIRTERLLALL